MFIMSCAMFAYVFISLLLPLRISWIYKFGAAAVLFAIANRGAIMQRLGGGMFFAPNLPYAVMFAASYLYGAFVVMFFMLVVKDAGWLLLRIFSKRPFPREAAALVILTVSALLSAYGTWSALRVPDVQVEEVTLKNLPRELDGMKIALLADLHVSALNTAPLINAIVERTNSLSPDVILLNGDMIDGRPVDRRDDIAPLGRLRAARGVFGSTGNHEYYSGYREWSGEYKKLGITMLDNEHTVVASGDGRLVVAGVPDRAGVNFGFDAPDVGKALEGAPDGVPVILMEHRPENAPANSSRGVDIQLSGHTHGGMMPLLSYVVARANGGFLKGWYELGGLRLYVSPGTLLWNGFAIRIGDPAEITLFILRCPRDA